MDAQTLTIILFAFNIMIGLIITVGGFAVQRYIRENDRKWDEQRQANEDRARTLETLNINHEKNRADISKLEQRERMIEANNAEKFAEMRNEFADIKKAINDLNITIRDHLMKK